MDAAQTLKYMEEIWDASCIPTLHKYIEIPNQSPHYDPDIFSNGYQEQVIELYVEWAKKLGVEGLKVEVVTEKDRTPVVLMTVEATNGGAANDTILLYGHVDKQPPLTEQWAEGLHPYKPVQKDGKLYGRGGADDGYAMFAALTAIKAIQLQGKKHSRMVLLLEASEESGSTDLNFYLERLKPQLGDVGLIVCLDSGCGNYEQLWLTTSLRGIVAGTLRVDVLKNGIHSGAGSGAIASSFRVIRQLLDRVEDSKTGKVLLKELYTDIPESRLAQAKKAADFLGFEGVFGEVPFVGDMKPMNPDITECLLNKTWRPQLSYVGIDGIPSIASAGNVLRAYTALKLSMRIPPFVDAEQGSKVMEAVLTKDPPYDAKVTWTGDQGAAGWSSPELEAWLEKSVENASKAFWEKPAGYMGEGGSIPFMGTLGRMFPKAQFVVTGVLGPASNAHGPDEFLHIAMAKRIAASVAHISYDYATKQGKKE